MVASLTQQNKQTARRKALIKATQGLDKCPDGKADKNHYARGCRSAECREAYRIYERERKAGGGNQ